MGEFFHGEASFLDELPRGNKSLYEILCVCLTFSLPNHVGMFRGKFSSGWNCLEDFAVCAERIFPGINSYSDNFLREKFTVVNFPQ